MFKILRTIFPNFSLLMETRYNLRAENKKEFQTMLKFQASEPGWNFKSSSGAKILEM